MEQQIQRLKEKIIETIPDQLSPMEQVRYLYIELGKLVSFDERYWKGNSKTKKKIYRVSFRKRIEDLKADRRIICVSLARMFQELLAEIGVKATLYQPDPEDPHINNIVEIDRKQYVMDLQRDLEYIQTNRRTQHFGKKSKKEYVQFSEISSEEEEKIDRRIGYVQEDRDYTEHYLWMLQKAIEGEELSLEEKVAFVLEHAKDYKDLSQVGIVEKSKFYTWCFERCFTPEERRYITENYLQTVEDSKILSCITVRGKKNHYTRFLFQEKKNCHLQIDEEEFKHLLKTRMKALPSEVIPGMKKGKLEPKIEGEAR